MGGIATVAISIGAIAIGLIKHFSEGKDAAERLKNETEALATKAQKVLDQINKWREINLRSPIEQYEAMARQIEANLAAQEKLTASTLRMLEAQKEAKILELDRDELEAKQKLNPDDVIGRKRIELDYSGRRSAVQQSSSEQKADVELGLASARVKTADELAAAGAREVRQQEENIAHQKEIIQKRREENESIEERLRLAQELLKHPLPSMSPEDLVGLFGQIATMKGILSGHVTSPNEKSNVMEQTDGIPGVKKNRDQIDQIVADLPGLEKALTAARQHQTAAQAEAEAADKDRTTAFMNARNVRAQGGVSTLKNQDESSLLYAEAAKKAADDQKKADAETKRVTEEANRARKQQAEEEIRRAEQYLRERETQDNQAAKKLHGPAQERASEDAAVDKSRLNQLESINVLLRQVKDAESAKMDSILETLESWMREKGDTAERLKRIGG